MATLPAEQNRSLSERAALLRKAFAQDSAAAVPVVIEHFSAVHTAVAKGKLPEEDWIELLPVLPSIGFFSDWDRCERLRRAAIYMLARRGGCIGKLMREMSAREIQFMVKSCLSTGTGQRLLQQLISEEV
jgi:hypothetical protein